MRVFYPVSARLADIVNDDARVPSSWMILWSIVCIALFAMLLSALPSFGAGTAQAPDHFISRYLHPANLLTHSEKDAAIAQPVHAVNSPLRPSTQEYIDAHRYAQYFAAAKSDVAKLPVAEPLKLKAVVGRYL